MSNVQYQIPPADSPERWSFDHSHVGNIDRTTGKAVCHDCVVANRLIDTIRIFGVNVAPYKMVCSICQSTIVSGGTDVQIFD